MDSERTKVFKYNNGVKDIFGDPLRIQRELYLALGDPDAAFEAAYPDKPEDKFNPEQIKALNCILDNAREVFHMVPYDAETGQGATDEDVEAALESLWAYLEKKSTNSGMKPSSAPSTTSIPTACLTKP